MRVSIVEGDPGWVVDPISYRVTLDGEAVVAVTADEEAGECVVWERDLSGYPTTAVRRGRVHVERWEADDVDHPQGTIGWINEADGFWTWIAPSQPEYPHVIERKRDVMHIWDSERRAWLNPRHLARH